MRTVQFEMLRPGEILAEKARCSIVYLPIGPLEWHGPAMPYGTDPLAAWHAAVLSAQRTGGVVLPALFAGTERERSAKLLRDVGFEDDSQYIVGMDVPNNTMKSLYWPEEVLGVIVREYLRLLVAQGYRLIVLVNGHGASGQISTLDRLAIEFSNTTDSRVIVAMGLGHYEPDDRDTGHATRLETSIQMHLGPENVDLGQLPAKPEKLRSTDWGIVDGLTFDGNPPEDRCVLYDPRDATADMGARYLAAGVEHLARTVTQAYETI